MIKIRQGAFETNSSSMHSLIVMDGMKTESTMACSVYENKAYIRDNHFEREPFCPLNHWLDKAAYYIADNNNCKDEDVDKVVDEVLALIAKHHPEITGVEFHSKVKYEWDADSNKFVKTRNKIDDGEYHWYDMYNTYGEVDHQSEGFITSKIRKGEMTIEEFLFDPSIIVIIDGDEYWAFDKLKESGFIDESRIRKEYTAE